MLQTNYFYIITKPTISVGRTKVDINTHDLPGANIYFHSTPKVFGYKMADVTAFFSG